MKNYQFVGNYRITIFEEVVVLEFFFFFLLVPHTGMYHLGIVAPTQWTQSIAGAIFYYGTIITVFFGLFFKFLNSGFFNIKSGSLKRPLNHIFPLPTET